MRSDRDERGERGGKKISVRFPDTLPLGPQPAERFTRGAMRWYWTSLVDGPMLIRLLADGGGSSGRGQPAASPPFPAPPQTWRMAAGFGLQANGATPPLPLGRQPPLLDPGARQRVFRPTCSSFAPAPPLRAATGGLRHFLLPDLLSTAIPLSSEGSLTACPSFLPGFRHQCNEVDMYGKKEAGTGEHLNTFNNKINKHNRKAAAPHGRLPHTKHKVKFQAWSSLVFQCRHSSFYSFRSSSVGLETGEWRRCRSLSFTPPASLRSHGSRPRPTRHKHILLITFIHYYVSIL